MNVSDVRFQEHLQTPGVKKKKKKITVAILVDEQKWRFGYNALEAFAGSPLVHSFHLNFKPE